MYGTHTIEHLSIELQQITHRLNLRFHGDQKSTTLTIILSNGVPLSELGRLNSSLRQPHDIGLAFLSRGAQRTPAIGVCCAAISRHPSRNVVKHRNGPSRWRTSLRALAVTSSLSMYS